MRPCQPVSCCLWTAGMKRTNGAAASDPSWRAGRDAPPLGFIPFERSWKSYEEFCCNMPI
jgi:hypothetical protein